jgi:AcrR family transcriptional regulator
VFLEQMSASASTISLLSVSLRAIRIGCPRHGRQGEQENVAMSTSPAQRRPAERREEILRAARTVFLDTGYDGAGLAEVATEGGLSRGSIYRYFPAGRTDLFVAVADILVGELHERLRYAARVPFSPARRMEHLIGALFAFFDETPAAYRLLFRDVWTAGDAAVVGTVVGSRAILTADIASVLADADLSAAELAAASIGILGFALANVEATLDGAADSETAWQITCRFASSVLAA